jgi:hypothetical protein
MNRREALVSISALASGLTLAPEVSACRFVCRRNRVWAGSQIRAVSPPTQYGNVSNAWNQPIDIIGAESDSRVVVTDISGLYTRSLALYRLLPYSTHGYTWNEINTNGLYLIHVGKIDVVWNGFPFPPGIAMAGSYFLNFQITFTPGTGSGLQVVTPNISGDQARYVPSY